MATIQSKKWIIDMLQHDGLCTQFGEESQENPKAFRIYRFDSAMSKQEEYAVFQNSAEDDLWGKSDTEFCKDIQMLFCEGYLTDRGKIWLKRESEQ